MDFVKRFLPLPLILVCVQQNSFSQRAVYDATYLKRFVHNEDGKSYVIVSNDSVANILISYIPDSARRFQNASFRYKVLQRYYDNVGGAGIANPFIDLPGEQQETRNFSVSSLSSSLANVGGLDVTNLADGMAKFLVARTKQELSAAFFDRFRAALADTNYRDLQTLFPSTCITLDAIGDEIYNFDAFIQTLRESFEKDLRQLAVNLPKIVDNHPDFFARHKELTALLKSGCFVAQELNDKQHPGQILRDYPPGLLHSLNRNWQGAIETLQLISESLRDSAQVTNSTSYWVSPKQIASLFGDSVTFKIYLGLLYEQAATLKQCVRFEGGWTLCGALDTVALYFPAYYENYRAYYSNLSDQENRLTSMLSAQKKISNDSQAVQQYYAYAMATVDFLEAASEVGRLVPVDRFKKDDRTKEFFQHARSSMAVFFSVARSSVDVIWDIKRRSYASAIVNVVSIYNRTVTDTAQAELAAAKSKLASWLTKAVDHVKGDSVSIAYQDSLQTAIHRLQAEVGLVGPFLRYGTFIATIVQAGNSDDVEKAIEAFALPAGSSRIKRESAFNVALNAYAGLRVGGERISDVGNSTSFGYGVSAPIGVAVSWGHDFLFWSCDAGWSTTLYVSLVDIGAIAAYRAQSGNVSSIPTVHLRDIVSPGLFLSMGIPKSPISINLGAQVGANQYAVTGLTNSSLSSAYYRFSLAFCVDIPLLDFYSKPSD